MRKCITCKHYQTATGVMDWCDKGYNLSIMYKKYKRCKDYNKESE